MNFTNVCCAFIGRLWVTRRDEMLKSKTGMEDGFLSSVGAGDSTMLEAPTKITALVVDDDTINQMFHHRLLDNLGIRNQVVRNGKEAIDVHCSGKNFDLILMDMEMPVMNGIEVYTLSSSSTEKTM